MLLALVLAFAVDDYNPDVPLKRSDYEGRSLRELTLGGFIVDFGPQKHTASKYVDLTILTADGRVRH